MYKMLAISLIFISVNIVFLFLHPKIYQLKTIKNIFLILYNILIIKNIKYFMLSVTFLYMSQILKKNQHISNFNYFIS